MIEWTLHVSYAAKPYQLKATLVYESSQVMRIEVKGNASTLLLQNNYPIIRASRSTKAMQWKLIQGHLKNGNAQDARLLTEIMQELEYNIKKDFPKLF